MLNPHTVRNRIVACLAVTIILSTYLPDQDRIDGKPIISRIWQGRRITYVGETLSVCRAPMAGPHRNTNSNLPVV